MPEQWFVRQQYPGRLWHILFVELACRGAAWRETQAEEVWKWTFLLILHQEQRQHWSDDRVWCAEDLLSVAAEMPVFDCKDKTELHVDCRARVRATQAAWPLHIDSFFHRGNGAPWSYVSPHILNYTEALDWAQRLFDDAGLYGRSCYCRHLWIPVLS